MQWRIQDFPNEMGSNLTLKPRTDVIKKSKSKNKDITGPVKKSSKICLKEIKETTENNCLYQALILKYKYRLISYFFHQQVINTTSTAQDICNCSKSYQWTTWDIFFSCVFQCIHSTHTNDLKIVRP